MDTEDSKLIGDFLGIHSDEVEHIGTKDWNLIMDIVEKIENLIKNNCYLYYVEICRDSCFVHKNQGNPETMFSNSVPNNRKESCYLTLVQFLKWYKEQNNEK